MSTGHTDGIFLDFSIRKLRQLTARIRASVERFDEQQLWTRAGEEQNAAGNLLLHLAGNVGQWIGSAIGGRPDRRARDAEFAARQGTREELLERLEAAVEEAAQMLRKLPPGRLTERVTIQGYDVTVLEAIYHVVEHFAQHTGQIILLAKLHSGRGMDFYGHLAAGAHRETTP